MATIIKRGKRWSAQIRRKGYPSQSRTFESKADARAWATLEEARMERGETTYNRSLLNGTTLDDILARYIAEVSLRKRGAEAEMLRIQKMRRDPIAEFSLSRLTSATLAEYRDRRLRHAQPATVHRELAIISHALDVAHREWGVAMPRNPAKDIRKPPSSAARDRRLAPREYDRIIAAAKATRNPQVLTAIQLAIETALRRGELLDLTWERVDLSLRVASIPHTKTDLPRTIPLTDGAVRQLHALGPGTGPIFQLTGNALRLSWVRILKRAGIDDLRFHDLRHEAISRFFELGLSLPEVALISGHRDPRMLLRYTQLRAVDVASKLRGARWGSVRTRATDN